MPGDTYSQIDSIDTLDESRAVFDNESESTTLAPINRLPHEILGRIFSIAVAASPCSLASGERDILSQLPLVCAQWYQAATGNRLLWSHIDIGSCLTSTSPLQTNRNRLWLERSHGLPVHLHVDIDHPQTEVAISNLVSILEPHRTSTISLVITGMNLVLARTLFALYLGDSGAGALNTLVVSGVWDKELTIPWSTYSIRGLTALELYNLQQPACPALDELTTMLSNCPHLRTLRLSHLRNSIIRRNEQRNRRTISLPHLQLLDVAGLEGDVLAVLLGMIHPGKLDLHVRLGIRSGEHRVSPAALLLFARSNVASLALSSDASNWILNSKSPFTCLLGLRALRVDCTDSSPETLLEALTHHNMLQSLPSLQLLCISGGEVDQGFMDDVKSLVGARPLRSLLFWSCKFPVFYRRVANKVKLQDRSRGSDGAANLSYRPMPETTKKWLMKRVERLVISETPPTRISDNVDALAQEMTKLDSADYL